MVNLSSYNIKNGCYLEKDLLDNFEIVKKIDNGIICLRHIDNSWIEFVVGSFSSSNLDGSNVEYDIFWNGCGTSDPLRELRHSWIGDEDGYIYYINKDIFTEAFNFLNNYFDMSY